METFWVQVIAETGHPELPIGTLTTVETFHHIPFGPRPPQMSLATPAGPRRVRPEQVRRLSAAEAKLLRAAAKRARRQASRQA